MNFRPSVLPNLPIAKLGPVAFGVILNWGADFEEVILDRFPGILSGYSGGGSGGN
jgi:hypothetical protein